MDNIMDNIKIVMCKHTKKEVLAQYFEEDIKNEYDGWLHLHNEDEENDLEDINYFKETGKVLQRDIDGNKI